MGGQRLFLGEQSYDIRGIGLLGSGQSALHDIENVVIAEQKGTPVRVQDIADIDMGHAPRLGIVGYDDKPDVVQGIVLMRYGAETPPRSRASTSASTTSGTTISCLRGWISSPTTTAAPW